MTDELEHLKRVLAAIEHDRWRTQQSYLHERSRRKRNGEVVLPAEFHREWDRRMRLRYEDLQLLEQSFAMAEVERYWPLVERYLVWGEKLQAALDGVKALHEPTIFDEGAVMCGCCETRWPCETAQLIERADLDPQGVRSVFPTLLAGWQIALDLSKTQTYMFDAPPGGGSAHCWHCAKTVPRDTWDREPTRRDYHHLGCPWQRAKELMERHTPEQDQ
ncbi:MAG: hypothetical protein ACM3ZF_13860 [Mycobacterium leprae]